VKKNQIIQTGRERVRGRRTARGWSVAASAMDRDGNADLKPEYPTGYTR
jgi:hypothetical protein